MKNIITLLALLILAAPASATLDCRSSSRDYFSETQPLKWVIIGDFRTVNDANIYLSEKEKASSLGRLITENKEFPVKINARGAFRFEECEHRPFELKLQDADHLKGVFPFEKHFSEIKLTTICSTYDRSYVAIEIRKLMKEYTIYKMLKNFQSSVLDIRLIEFELRQPDGSVYLKAPGFVRETKKALAARCEKKVREPIIKKWDNEKKISTKWLLQKDRSLKPYLYRHNTESVLRTEFINMFLNNIDFIIEEDHNVISLVAKDSTDLNEYFIPYDFDLSQAAGGTYYSFTGTPEHQAQVLKNWLVEKAQSEPSAIEKIKKDFASSVGLMKSEITGSPLLDAQGQTELLNWVTAFERAVTE